MGKKIVKIIITILICCFVLIISYLFFINYNENLHRNNVAEIIYGQSLGFINKIQGNQIINEKKIGKIFDQYSYLKKFELNKFGSGCFVYELNLKTFFNQKDLENVTILKTHGKEDCYEKNSNTCTDLNLCKLCLTEKGILQREQVSNCK